MTEKILEGRSILIIGGSSGIGLKAVAEFAKDGATVYMGTRYPDNFEKAKQQLTRREKLDLDALHVYPFYADVTDRSQIRRAAGELRGKPDITDVIFSQGSGMEGFTKPLFEKYMDPISKFTFNTPIEELGDKQRQTVEEKLTAMVEGLDLWTSKALNGAVAVNYRGTFDVIDILADTLQHGFRGIFYNSTWGYLSGRKDVKIPFLYRPVNLSKALVRNRLRHEGGQLQQRGIPMGVVVASLVNDTQVGKMFNDFFLNLMDADQREAVRVSSITRLDVVNATRLLLDSDPDQWPNYPYNRFVYRRGGEVVVEDQLELSAMYTKPYRF